MLKAKIQEHFMHPIRKWKTCLNIDELDESNELDESDELLIGKCEF